jgi:hypothetical protein
MSKTSTLHLTINNLASRSNEELINTDSVFDFQKEFGDVLEVLDQLNVDVRQEVVNHLLEMTSKFPV